MELIRRIALLVLSAAVLAACDRPRETADVASEMEDVLVDEVLEVWYPLVVDTLHGGFLTRFTYDWTPEDPQDKMLVTQARHLWTASRAAERYSSDERYLEAAHHGFSFLRDVMWDAEHGGFFNLVERDGTPKSDQDGPLMKYAYGNSFAIYSLAAYYRATGDSAALDLAFEAFDWLESHSHDPARGGYYQFMDRDGTPHTGGYGGIPPKDQNSSIHLLEAFTELYDVHQDSLVGARTQELLSLIRDVMVSDRGYLRLFFQDDWTPLSYRDSSEATREANYFYDHVSFGHDVETAYLMLDAERVLGDPSRARTLRIARQMVDHALQFGWDENAGGFFDRGYYFNGTPEIILDSKNWWAQAEALNTLQMMDELFPVAGYADRFTELWTYVKGNLIDYEHGGWYEYGLDKSPEAERALKAHIWKGNYHTVRSLMQCIDRIRGPESSYLALDQPAAGTGTPEQLAGRQNGIASIISRQ